MFCWCKSIIMLPTTDSVSRLTSAPRGVPNEVTANPVFLYMYVYSVNIAIIDNVILGIRTGGMSNEGSSNVVIDKTPTEEDMGAHEE